MKFYESWCVDRIYILCRGEWNIGLLWRWEILVGDI